MNQTLTQDALERKARKTIAAIVLFVIVYLIFVLAALALLAGTFVASFYILNAHPRFLVLVVCLLSIATSGLIVYFLFKFHSSAGKRSARDKGRGSARLFRRSARARR